MIVCPATGLDHIDFTACYLRGIEVLSLQGETEFLQTIPSTAEYTWALILALVRKIPWAFDDVRKGNWDRDAFQGMELKGKNLGILGVGRVGRQVIDIAQSAFQMNTSYCDEKYGDWSMVEINHFLETQPHDILTIHVPLNDETRGMLDEERLRILPRGAYVVNTSRAEIVDERAMYSLLTEGHIAGYATDFPFPEHPKALVTPHLGGNTKEAREKTDTFMQAKLARWLQEHPLSVASPVS